jgi:hypothetical protein
MVTPLYSFKTFRLRVAHLLTPMYSERREKEKTENQILKEERNKWLM